MSGRPPPSFLSHFAPACLPACLPACHACLLVRQPACPCRCILPPSTDPLVPSPPPLVPPYPSIFVGSFCNDLIDGPGRYYHGGLAVEKVGACVRAGCMMNDGLVGWGRVCKSLYEKVISVCGRSSMGKDATMPQRRRAPPLSLSTYPRARPNPVKQAPGFCIVVVVPALLVFLTQLSHLPLFKDNKQNWPNSTPAPPTPPHPHSSLPPTQPPPQTNRTGRP